MPTRFGRRSPSDPGLEVDQRPSRARVEEFAEHVLRIAESVPAGRVVSYGGIADALAEDGRPAAPRQVGKVMALDGAAVPWWRVVRADGTLPEHLRVRAREHYLAEGTPLRGGLTARTCVDMSAAEWYPVTDA